MQATGGEPASRRPRRVLLWLLTGVCLIVVGFTTFAALHRSPYAFLDAFHPRSYEVKNTIWYVHGSPPPPTKETMLVFDPKTENAVIAEVRRHLTTAAGYKVEDFGAPVRQLRHEIISSIRRTTNDPAFIPPEISDEDLRFTRGDDLVEVMYGSRATLEMESRLDPSKTSFDLTSAPSCIVILSHQETWIDRQIDAIRNFLHLG